MQVKADKRIEAAAVKAWERPTLRRLPIAATAGVGEFNEGGGKGKGASGPNPVS
jgi:hypothetical protein